MPSGFDFEQTSERYALKGYAMKVKILLMAVAVTGLGTSCTQETQNTIGRTLQNWTGTNGVLDVYAGDKLVNRFVKIDKLSTAMATSGEGIRPYRFGYGHFDTNHNYKVDSGEKKVYFEISDYSTNYVFYENPFH